MDRGAWQAIDHRVGHDSMHALHNHFYFKAGSLCPKTTVGAGNTKYVFVRHSCRTVNVNKVIKPIIILRDIKLGCIKKTHQNMKLYRTKKHQKLWLLVDGETVEDYSVLRIF